MKKILSLFSISVLLIASNASAELINQTRDSDRVVYDSTTGLYWYPAIDEFIGMTKAEQKVAIANLNYAGSTSWYMASYYDTTAMKNSLAGMGTVLPTTWGNFGEEDSNPDSRTLGSPYLAYDVYTDDFFNYTSDIPDGAFFSEDTAVHVYNGRTDTPNLTEDVTNNGLAGSSEALINSNEADDHWVSHSSETPDNDYATMLFNYDQHYFPDDLSDDHVQDIDLGGKIVKVDGFIGPVGAWVVSKSVPEPSTILLLMLGLAGIVIRRKI